MSLKYAYRILSWNSVECDTIEYVDSKGKFTTRDKAQILFDDLEVREELIRNLQMYPNRWFMVERGTVSISIEWDTIATMTLVEKGVPTETNEPR